MDNLLHDNLINMVKQSAGPMMLADESLEVLACSIPFYRTIVSFHDNIHNLFDANAIQRIKRSRRSGRSVKIKTKTAPFVLNMCINWFRTGEDQLYMIGIVESNYLIDANRSLTIAYSCTDRSAKAINFIMDLLDEIKERGEISANETAMLLHDAKTLNRNYEHLRHCMNILTDSLVLHRQDTDIVRIIRLCVQRAQTRANNRNIRIASSLLKCPRLVNCDLKYLTMAVADCLACMLCFTQDNHRLTVEMTEHDSQYEILLTDPVFQIPEKYADELLTGDVKLPGYEYNIGLYFANTVILKHGGLLELEQFSKIGYQLRLTIPAAPRHHLVFEDIDDSRITDLILQYADISLFDL